MDQQFLQDFMAKIGADEPLFENFYRAVKGGKNKVFHNVVSEALTLDDSWIVTLENALFSVERIVKNPRRFIIDEDLVVDVERARRTTAKTVRHLASNTRNISSISSDGEVRPKKVLTTEMKEDLAIYENRFLCTLVQRLVPFVEQRSSDIKSKMHVYDVTSVNMDSAFSYGDSELSYRMELKVKEPPHDKLLLERNNELMARIEQLRKRLKVLQGTPFMRELSARKPVRPPIMKTNLLKMNVDYANCYKLWLYVSSYSFVGYSVEVKEKLLPVDGDYYEDMTVLSALSLKAMLENNVVKKSAYEAIPFSQPREKNYKVLTSYKYRPSFTVDTRALGEDAVNEYYFRQMREAFARASRSREGGAAADERTLSMNFERFYRSVAKINNEMYLDVIREQNGKRDLKRRTPLRKKEEAYREQQLIYRRIKQLSKLKSQDLERQLKLESRELVKLEKAKFELDKERGRVQTKRELDARKRQKLERVKAKGAAVRERAEVYEGELLDRELERRAQLEEQKRVRREEGKRRRELKKLEELKEKYEDHE